jgi:hypothetical protein
MSAWLLFGTPANFEFRYRLMSHVPLLSYKELVSTYAGNLCVGLQNEPVRAARNGTVRCIAKRTCALRCEKNLYTAHGHYLS